MQVSHITFFDDGQHVFFYDGQHVVTASLPQRLIQPLVLSFKRKIKSVIKEPKKEKRVSQPKTTTTTKLMHVLSRDIFLERPVSFPKTVILKLIQ